jgi:hypothetical protein
LTFILILMYGLCNLFYDVRGIITEHNAVLLRLWATCIPMDMSCDVHGKVSAVTVGICARWCALQVQLVHCIGIHAFTLVFYV